jgi:DNA polymerase elongation subunit (family B)
MKGLPRYVPPERHPHVDDGDAPIRGTSGGGGAISRPLWQPRFLDPRPAEWFRPRPPVDYLKPGGSITFMHMDTTYRPWPGRAVIEIHGVTREGYSVWVNVKQFLPNFFIRLFPHQNAEQIKNELEQRLQRKFFKDPKYGRRARYIERWQRVDNVRSIMCYSTDNPYVYYQVFMNHPKHVAAAREFMVRGTGASHHSARVEETFEANVLYDLRYMVDHGLHGCQWVTFRNIRIVPQGHPERVSRAQLEVIVDADDTLPLQGKVQCIQEVLFPSQTRLRRVWD